MAEIMKSISVKGELRAVHSICNGKEDIKSILLGFLNDGHFGDEDTIKIFKRIKNLASKNKSVPKSFTLSEDIVLPETARVLLKNRKKFKIVKSKKEAKALISMLEEYRKFRVIKNGLLKSSELISADVIDVNNLISRWEQIILNTKTADSDGDIVHIGRGGTANKLVKKIIKGDSRAYIPTGIKQFDSVNGGFRKGNLVIIAATTSGGKSALAIQLLINMYLYGLDIALVSLEMDNEEVLSRILSNLAEVDGTAINLGGMNFKQKESVKKAWKSFQAFGKKNECRYTLYSPSGDLSLHDILFRLKPYKYSVHIIDYISLLKEGKEDQWKSLGKYARQAKLFAKSTNSVVVLLAQLDDNEHVRYARSIKEHSDNLWTWVYGSEARKSNVIYVNQQKARNQKIFPFSLYANFNFMTFRDYTEKITNKPTQQNYNNDKFIPLEQD